MEKVSSPAEAGRTDPAEGLAAGRTSSPEAELGSDKPEHPLVYLYRLIEDLQRVIMSLNYRVHMLESISSPSNISDNGKGKTEQ